MGSNPESPESEGVISANKVQWQANPGACEKCNELDGQYFSQGNEPEKPHPNCNCKIVECYYVNEYGRWKEISRSVPSYNMQDPIFTQLINSTLVLWMKSYYITEERNVNICIGCGTRREVLETNNEHRKRKIKNTEYSIAYCASTTKIDEWSVWWCANPWVPGDIRRGSFRPGP